MKLNRYILVFASFVILLGCNQQDSSDPQAPVEDKQEIKFNFFVKEGDRVIPYEDYWSSVNPSTRAGDSDLPSGFTLYGVWNSVDVPNGSGVSTSSEDAPANMRFFDGVSINKDGSYLGGQRYWVTDGETRHTFAAVSGYGTTGVGFVSGFTKSSFIPITRYVMSPDPAKQTDLLVAYGPVNVVVNGNTPVVNINFKHALSKIQFKLMVQGGVTLYDCQLNVTYKANTIKSTAEYYYTGKAKSLASTYLPASTYSVSIGVTVPASAISEDTSIEIGNLKMNPGLDLPNDWLELELIYAISSGGTKSRLKTNVPANVFQQGCQYTYYLQVNQKSENLAISNITLAPWTTEIRLIDPLK